MSVPITLDRPRTIRFTLRAIRDLERAMDGVPMTALMGRVVQGGADAIVTALWAGLKHEDDRLTIDKTERILEKFLDTHPITDVTKALNDAIVACGIFKNIAAADEEPEAAPEGNAPAEPAAP